MAERDGISTCARCGRRRRCSTGPTRTSRSAGARFRARPTTTRSRSSRAGITVHEALKAADALAEEGVSARVIDLYSIKPLDEETLRDAAEATGGRIVTVEDHWPEGGLGEAVLAAFADAEERPRVKVLAVSGMPHSGKPAELLAAAGIDADAHRAGRAGAGRRRRARLGGHTEVTLRAVAGVRPRPWPTRTRLVCRRTAPLAWAMAVVTASNLRKELAGNLLFDGVSFKLERRDRLSLSGPNGAGKTTLLRMLAGETEIHGGELAFTKGTRVALHDQRPPLERSLTLREYVLSGAGDLSRWRTSWVASSRRWPRGDHDRRDDAPLLGRAGAARARRRLRLARADGGRRARPRVRRARPRPAADDLLGRRADPRLARPRARRRPRPPAPRRADQPPGRLQPRVARARARVDGRGRSCSSRTTAGSSRRRRPPCSSSAAAARPTSPARGTPGGARRRRARSTRRSPPTAWASTSPGWSGSWSASGTRRRRPGRPRRS